VAKALYAPGGAAEVGIPSGGVGFVTNLTDWDAASE